MFLAKKRLIQLIVLKFRYAIISQLAFSSPKSTIKELKKGVEYVQR